MAHGLEIIDGKASMAYAGVPPWHNTKTHSTHVLNGLTPQEMMKEAGVDWTVALVPAFAKVGQGYVDTNTKALVRTSDNTVLSMVGPRWVPVQNAEAFAFYNEFVADGSMTMETAGALCGGKMVWALAKLKDSFTLFGGDTVQGYLLFSNPHLYGKKVKVKLTPIRVVCWNTLQLALNKQTEMTIEVNHSREFDPEKVRLTLGLASIRLTQYKQEVEFLGSKQHSKAAVSEYFKRLFPTSMKTISRPAAKMIETLETQPGREFAPGSWWQAYNSVTYTIDHLLGNQPDTRMYQAWYGNRQKQKLRALESALEYSRAA